MPSKEEIRWQELAAHFRAVQAKHEKARRQAAGGDMSAPFADYPTLEEREREREAGSLSPPLGMSGAGGAGSGAGAGGSGGGRSGSGSGSGSGIKRKGDGPAPLVIPSRAGALSPLNPRARGSGLLASALGGGKVRPTSPSTNQNVMSKAQGQRAASAQKGA
jgi:vacuole morphology and inheritance protein 14